MRSTGKTDLTGLFKYYKEHVDPEFVRFETSFKSRTLPELARLAAFFKSWNDDPTGSDILGEASAPLEDAVSSEMPCEQLLQEQEKRLATVHAEEISRLECQLRDSMRANDQVLAALARNSTYDKTIAGLLER